MVSSRAPVASFREGSVPSYATHADHHAYDLMAASGAVLIVVVHLSLFQALLLKMVVGLAPVTMGMDSPVDMTVRVVDNTLHEHVIYV